MTLWERRHTSRRNFGIKISEIGRGISDNSMRGERHVCFVWQFPRSNRQTTWLLAHGIAWNFVCVTELFSWFCRRNPFSRFERFNNWHRLVTFLLFRVLRNGSNTHPITNDYSSLLLLCAVCQMPGLGHPNLKLHLTRYPHKVYAHATGLRITSICITIFTVSDLSFLLITCLNNLNPILFHLVCTIQTTLNLPLINLFVFQLVSRSST